MAINILATLAQVQTTANEILTKVKNKGYAVASDLGTLASKNEVGKNDLASTLATEITNATSNITTQTSRINTLVGNEVDDDTKSVRTISAEEVAKIVASAPASFDTLKEIADWISTHGDDAAAMNSAITALQSKTLLGSHEVNGEQVEYASVKAYVEAVAGAAGLSGSDSINIANGIISAIVNSGNGLSSGANGITLNTVVASTNGTGGSNGAMTAAQAEKLASINIATTQQLNDMIAGLDSL